DAAVALLEDDAGRKRELGIGRVAVGDEARQDQHALAVDGPAELDLALDVNHLTTAGACGRGNARWPAKAEIAELKHRQAVDLTAGSALGRDHDGAAVDLLEAGLTHTPGAHVALLDGLLHVLAADGIRRCLAGQVAGLGEYVTQHPIVGAELAL